MKELIDPHQAQVLMLAVLFLAPLIGLLWGWRAKRTEAGLLVGGLIGMLIGGGNFALWTLYNALTDRLGLDTVQNLLVNLGLFVALGLAVGSGIGWAGRRKRSPKSN